MRCHGPSVRRCPRNKRTSHTTTKFVLMIGRLVAVQIIRQCGKYPPMSFKNVKRLTAVALDPEVLGPCHIQHEIDVCDKAKKLGFRMEVH